MVNTQHAALLLIFLVTTLFFSCSQKEETISKPNILFIAVDDLRPEISFFGNEVIQTPNLDKLSSQGRAFFHHFVQAPTCGASRYALLTGNRPDEKIHLSNRAIYEEIAGKDHGDQPESFIHLLRKNNYYTVGMGKISHSPDGYIYGYEEQPSDQMELSNSWDEFHFNSGKWGTGWNAFFGYADGSNRQGKNRQVKPYERGNVSDTGYVDGLTANLALDNLRKLAQKDQPFFLGVGFFKPHLPFTAPAKYWDLYDRENIPVSPNPSLPENVNRASLQNNGEFNGYQNGDEKAVLGDPVSEAYARKLNHAYYACVSYIDAQIGKLLQELKDLGLEDNTVVVVWGDHGWHLGDHTVWGKHTIFERSLKSPLIIKMPGMEAPGTPAKGMVETLDIYPTLMEICRVSAPAGLDGKSLVPMLNNPDTTVKESAFGYFRRGISMRTDRYRFTKYFREAEPTIELYDHQNDPFETANVAEEHPEIVEELLPKWKKGNTGIYE